MNEHSEPGPYEDVVEIDLREYLLMLWNKKWFILGLIVVAAIGAYVFTVMTTEVQYESQAGILIMSPRYTEVEVARMSRSNYANLAKSDDIYRRIIEKLDLTDDEGELLSTIDIEGSMDLQIVEDDDFDPEGEVSYLFQLSVTRKDPEEASEMVNTWAEFIQEDTLEIRRGEIEEIFEVTERRFEETETNLEEAEERLQNLKEEARLERLIDRKDSYHSSIRSMENELLSLQEELGVREIELEQVELVLDEEPEKFVLEQSLTEDVFWERIFSPEELDIMSDFVLENEIINQVYQSLRQDRADLRVQVEALPNQLEFLEQRIQELEIEIENLEEQVWKYEREIESVKREVNRYEESYNRLSSQLEDARLASAEQTSDVRFVSTAVPPGRKIGRGIKLNVAIAVVLALMLGVFIVSFQEFMKE